jgi:hypothetical protein
MGRKLSAMGQKNTATGQKLGAMEKKNTAMGRIFTPAGARL